MSDEHDLLGEPDDHDYVPRSTLTEHERVKKIIDDTRARLRNTRGDQQ